jgi:hypothetical protein
VEDFMPTHFLRIEGWLCGDQDRRVSPGAHR